VARRRLALLVVLVWLVCLAALSLRSTGRHEPAAPASPSINESSAQRARGVVERAIAAHGGRQVWRTRHDAVYATTWTHYEQGRPDVSSRYTVKLRLNGPSGPLSEAVVQGDENGSPVLMGISGWRSWFHVGTQRYEDVASLKANRAFIRRAGTLLTVPFCLDDPGIDLQWDGQEVRAGMVVDRIRAARPLWPDALYLFDRSTGRASGIGSPVSETPTWSLGHYAEFTEIDGILIPSLQIFERHDPATGRRHKSLSISVDQARFRNGLDPSTFEPPAGM